MSTPCKSITAKQVADPFIEEIISILSSSASKPLLRTILANEDPGAKQYAKATRAQCRKLGIEFELDIVEKDKLEDRIEESNKDPNVHGIMIYWPVFGGGQDQYLQSIVASEKDVEGLNHVYIRNMYRNERYIGDKKSILPCTPLAIVKILQYIGFYNEHLDDGDRLYGKNIVILNRSEVVGRPLAAMLAHDGAKVYSKDIDSLQLYTRGTSLQSRKHTVQDITDKSLEEVIASSDVVICGIPSSNYKFPCQHIRDGALCINFSYDKNFGPEVVERAGFYVESIGKVTNAMLLRNLVRLWSYYGETNEQIVGTS